MKAYRIVGWKEQYEVTDKGKQAAADTPVELLKTKPLDYVRRRGSGHNLSPAERKIAKKAWVLGPLMNYAAEGIFSKLLDLAKDQPAGFRGWILDEKQQPLDIKELAELLNIEDLPPLKKLVEILLDSEIKWIEEVDFCVNNTDSPEVGGEKGKKGEKGGSLWGNFGEAYGGTLGKLQNESESEDKVNISSNGSTSSPQGGLPSSHSISQSDFSASDSARSPQADSARRVKTEAQFKFPLRPRTESDKTLLAAVFDQAEQKVADGIAGAEIFSQIIEAATKCVRADNPWAMFNSMVNESWFGYRRQERRGFFGKVFARGKT